MIETSSPCASIDLRPNALLITAASIALLTMLPVAAHQLGVLAHLPDPPGEPFASDRITGSKAAHPLGIPDSLLGLGSYGITFALILLARSHPKARRLLTLKLLGDGAVAAFNVVRQVATFGTICSWCTGTALCTAVMVAADRSSIVGEAQEWRRRRLLQDDKNGMDAEDGRLERSRCCGGRLRVWLIRHLRLPG